MQIIPDRSPARQANAGQSPFAWLNALQLRRSDLARLGADLRLEGGALLALHRDVNGAPLGVERVHPGRDGRLRYLYTPGARRGLVRAVPPGARRLLVAEGPLPAVAAAALDNPVLSTAYAGGGWCAVAAAAVRHLVLTHRIEVVVLAVAATPVGARVAERALEDLVDLRVHVEVAEAPELGGTWLDAVASARSVKGAG
jgi:hypothetical protein